VSSPRTSFGNELFGGYRTEGFWDEMFDAYGSPRECYQALHRRLMRIEPPAFADKARLADSAYLAQGITFAHEGRERPFPFDLLPRVIPADEWAEVERGLRQRVVALDRFCQDVYSPEETRAVRDGVIPNRLVVTSGGYQRAMVGVVPPIGRFIHLAGIDLIRDGDGRWLVLEDNARSPSGLSYVVQNRTFMRRVFPEAFRGQRVAPVGHAPYLLLAALQATAPEGTSAPQVVVLTPGPANAAYYDHAFLAQQMGVPLVEGRDLVVRNRRLYLKTTAGREPVDVVYRRVDDAFLDPASLRSDSMLGVTGLMQVIRDGRVAICNAMGTGVSDDKAIYAYVPDLIRYYLGEEPLLGQVPTYLPERPADLETVLDGLDRLFVKAVDGAGGHGMLVGETASPQEREVFARRVAAQPRAYIAQETIRLSRAPVMIDGRFQPRHVDLRPFVAYGASPVVVPGGLTRVALREGSLVVNSSQGGGSKDTWVAEARAR
jgi:uncharacterized circularly permuted ATP-grasp superfamily protein